MIFVVSKVKVLRLSLASGIVFSMFLGISQPRHVLTKKVISFV